MDALDNQIQLSFRGYFNVSFEESSRELQASLAFSHTSHNSMKDSVHNSAEYSINITTVESDSVEMNRSEEPWMVLFHSRNRKLHLQQVHTTSSQYRLYCECGNVRTEIEKKSSVIEKTIRIVVEGGDTESRDQS